MVGWYEGRVNLEKGGGRGGVGDICESWFGNSSCHDSDISFRSFVCLLFDLQNTYSIKISVRDFFVLKIPLLSFRQRSSSFVI